MNFDRHIADLEQDLGMTLTTIEAERLVQDDQPVSFDGIRTHYVDTSYVEHTVSATGFSFKQDGVTISGMFAKPVAAIRVLTDRDGGEFDSERFDRAISRAILAKLGPIPCRDEVVLVMAA